MPGNHFIKMIFERDLLWGDEKIEIKCKLICPNCGTKRDFSNP